MQFFPMCDKDGDNVIEPVFTSNSRRSLRGTDLEVAVGPNDTE